MEHVGGGGLRDHKLAWNTRTLRSKIRWFETGHDRRCVGESKGFKKGVGGRKRKAPQC